MRTWVLCTLLFVSSYKGFRTWIRHVRMYACTLLFEFSHNFFLENGSLLSRLAVRKGPLSSLLSHSVPAAPYAL